MLQFIKYNLSNIISQITKFKLNITQNFSCGAQFNQILNQI